MKVDLSVINSESFMVHAHNICGEQCFLVQPIHIGATWTPQNLIFRSSVWNSEGELISASYPKFFNWGEKPELSPLPSSLKGAVLMDKVDGSTLIISRYKGETVIRTRGTVDARVQDNGYEIVDLMANYMDFFNYIDTIQTSDVSWIFEWVSPSNRIVINYGDEPDMYLTGIVNHNDYSLWDQLSLDSFAALCKLRRPERFKYDSMEEMLSSVEALKGKEGLCVYVDRSQRIIKVKSAWYLYLHRAKSEISSTEKVIDVYLARMFEASPPTVPSYTEFFSYLETTFDYEIANIAMPNISKICDAMKQVQDIIGGMTNFLNTNDLFGSNRKDAAVKILQSYGTTGRTAMLFKMLDKKPLNSQDYKKLLFQCLKS